MGGQVEISNLPLWLVLFSNGLSNDIYLALSKSRALFRSPPHVLIHTYVECDEAPSGRALGSWLRDSLQAAPLRACPLSPFPRRGARVFLPLCTVSFVRHTCRHTTRWAAHTSHADIRHHSRTTIHRTHARWHAPVEVPRGMRSRQEVCDIASRWPPRFDETPLSEDAPDWWRGA